MDDSTFYSQVAVQALDCCRVNPYDRCDNIFHYHDFESGRVREIDAGAVFEGIFRGPFFGVMAPALLLLFGFIVVGPISLVFSAP